MDKKQITDYLSVDTPCHIIDINKLDENLRILRQVSHQSGCRLLLSIKGLSFSYLLSKILPQVDGFAASSLNESRLASELGCKEVHVYSPAYSKLEFPQIIKYCDYIIFNSDTQLKFFSEKNKLSHKQIGLRINPEISTAKRTAIDTCCQHSRFGLTISRLQSESLASIDGLHFHTMCEQFTGDLNLTLQTVIEKFSPFFNRIKWINLGGGQLITDPNYCINELISSIQTLNDKYGLIVFIEPGEAFFLNTGCLVATVNDIVYNGIDIAILDASAICHMPDVVNAPYRPEIFGAAEKYQKKYTYRLAGSTCYAGDIWGDYSFTEPLTVGSKIIFLDTAHYSIVKSNMFNGVRLPSIALYDARLRILKKYGYNDFLKRC